MNDNYRNVFFIFYWSIVDLQHCVKKRFKSRILETCILIPIAQRILSCYILQCQGFPRLKSTYSPTEPERTKRKTQRANDLIKITQLNPGIKTGIWPPAFGYNALPVCLFFVHKHMQSPYPIKHSTPPHTTPQLLILHYCMKSTARRVTLRKLPVSFSSKYPSYDDVLEFL